MAGYTGRSNTTPEDKDEYINATAFNSQIVKQRKKIIESSPIGSQSSFTLTEIAEKGGLGVAKSTTTFFDQFDASDIMKRANDFFGDITYDQADTQDETFNPDFGGELNLRQFRNYDDIVSDAQNQVIDDAPDQPGIGIGPNLLSPGTDEALNLAMRGQFGQRLAFSAEMEANNRGRGYGWSSDDHNSTTIGNYLSDKYKFNKEDERSGSDEVTSTLPRGTIQGESINTDAIDYNQPTIPQSVSSESPEG